MASNSVNKKINIYINDQQAGNTINELKKKKRQLNAEIERLPRNTQAYIVKVKQLKAVNADIDAHKAKIRGLGRGIKQADTEMKGMRKTALNISKKAGAIGAVVTAVVSAGRGFKAWVNANKEVEKSLSSLQSITGATTKDLKFYKKEALEIGRTTTLSGKQAIEGFKLIGSAAPELLKNRDALVDVTKKAAVLAEAAEIDLPTAAKATATALNQLGYEAFQTNRIINAVAAGSKEGAGDINYLNAALEKSGAVAADAKLDIEAIVGSIETIAPKISEPTTAGLQFKNMLLELAKGKDEYNPKVVGLNQALENLAKDGYGDTAKAADKFGKQNVVAATTLINQREKVEQLTNAVTGTSTAYEQAEINTRNLDGANKALASAWEGVLTSMDGNQILADVVNWMAEMLNTLTNLINGFKDWNTVKMEASMHKLSKILLPSLNLMFSDYMDNLIRVTGMADNVVDSIKDEAREVDILTTRLGQNNARLKDNATTQEEVAELNAENEEIVALLKDRYSEFTGEIDLHNASAEELADLQERINNNLVENAIKAAEAAEAERLLAEIVEKSMQMSRQRAKESDKPQWAQKYLSWATNNVPVLSTVVEKFELTAEASEKSMQKSIESLNGLDETMKDVEATIKDANINYGADFDAQTEMVEVATKKLEELRRQLKRTTDEGKKAGLEAAIDGQVQLIKKSGKLQQEALDDILKANEEAEEASQKKIDEAKERAAADRRKKAAAEAQRALDERKRQLEAIIKAEQKIREDLENQKRVDGAESEEEKELIELDIRLAQKYNKEIEAATELAKAKGEIGKKAAEELALLEALKKEESEIEKAKIEKKYADIRKEKEAEEIARKSKMEIDATTSLHNLEVLKAKTHLASLSNAKVSEQRKAMEKLKDAEIEQANWEHSLNLLNLEKKKEDGIISTEKYHADIEILTIEHEQRKADIEKAAKAAAADAFSQKIMEIHAEMEKYAGLIMNISNVVSTFQQARTDEELARIEKLEGQELQSLERRMEQGAISEEYYNQEKERINKRYRRREAQIKTEQAKKDRRAAILDAIVTAALATVKALAMTPFMPLGLIASATAAAMGVAQVAAIRSQPLPQFRHGGFHNVVGADDGRNYNAKYLGRHNGGMIPRGPSLVLVNEDEPEYFVPAPVVNNPRAAEPLRALEAIRLGQYREGGYTSTVNQSDSQGVNASEIQKRDAALDRELLNAINRLTDAIPNIKATIDDPTAEALSRKQEEIKKISGAA